MITMVIGADKELWYVAEQGMEIILLSMACNMIRRNLGG
jgi:hypothetical protein